MSDRLRPSLIASLLLGLLAFPSAASAQQSAGWHDSSPHRTTLVTVDEGVQLEVLDWGGAGRAIVLLAGLGDTAHVYDDFAPMLAREHHVYGVTRRGHPGSFTPPAGYEFARLAEDVVRVVKALALRKPVIVGHSIAGEELHVLGAAMRPRSAALSIWMLRSTVPAARKNMRPSPASCRRRLPRKPRIWPPSQPCVPFGPGSMGHPYRRHICEPAMSSMRTAPWLAHGCLPSRSGKPSPPKSAAFPSRTTRNEFACRHSPSTRCRNRPPT